MLEKRDFVSDEVTKTSTRDLSGSRRHVEEAPNVVFERSRVWIEDLVTMILWLYNLAAHLSNAHEDIVRRPIWKAPSRVCLWLPYQVFDKP